MPSLSIPESGLSFGKSSVPDSTMPTALGLTLTDGVIEEMIKCVQNGKPIQLSLGDHPILHYGTKIQKLSTSENPFTHELYRSSSSDTETSSNPHEMSRPLSNPKKGVIKVEQKSCPQFLAMLGAKSLTTKKPAATPTKATPKLTSASTTKTQPLTPAGDAALAQLQSSMASENAKKAGNTTKYIKDLLPAQGQRKGAAAKLGNKAKFLGSTGRPSDTTRSMPSSPNLSGVGSPSLGPTSVPLSQQQAEQAKATRKPVVHLLALSPMTETELKIKIPDASNNDIKQALQKVGDQNENSGKWELRKNFYKELDVWAFKYNSEEDRQRAIDNAVRQYDKMRLGVSEPEWDRLLPKEERGTGKCLSKLQAQIAQGPVAKAPKINVQKAEDSGRDTPAGGDDDEDVFGDKKLSKLKGESMTRSVSQPPATKSKKVSEKEAQAKRLLSKPKPKPAPAKKEKPAQKGARILSSQFVNDSDEEDDYMPVAKIDSKPSSTKRSREEEAESSDSSIPLSKKAKKDTTNHRISDASQSSRTTTTTNYSSSSSKTKSNSPQKSSPLASSPPTNASEVENSSGHTSSSASPAHSSIKVSRSPIHKRHQKSSSVASSVSSTTSTRSLKPEVMDLARRYRSFYPKYEALHKEVSMLGVGGRRDSEKEQKLLDMHQRLSGMKKDILAGIVEVN